jgi:hypothetical protein
LTSRQNRGVLRVRSWARVVRPLVTLSGVVLLATTMWACGGSPSAPSIPDCQYYDTGALVLINQGETLTPRDAYVDGRFVAVVPFGNQIVVDVAAGVIHTIEWVSTLGGGTVGSTRLVVDPCTTTALTNYF